jgi:hypothetical protein
MIEVTETAPKKPDEPKAPALTPEQQLVAENAHLRQKMADALAAIEGGQLKVAITILSP